MTEPDENPDAFEQYLAAMPEATFKGSSESRRCTRMTNAARRKYLWHRARREELKRAILLQHARLSESNRPVVCVPRTGDTDTDPGPRGPRVIFDSRTAAEQAATALGKIYRRTFAVYQCPRSRRGHHHLSDRTQYYAEGGAAPVADRP